MKWVRKYGCCECGCGASLVGLPVSTRFAPACAKRRHEERIRRLRKERLRSAAPRHPVERNPPEASPRAPQAKCSACGGMPWAREVDRYDEYWRPVAVVPPHTSPVAPPPVCRTCGGQYGNAPPLPRPSVLGSSAGTAARAAATHGLSFDNARTNASRRAARDKAAS